MKSFISRDMAAGLLFFAIGMTGMILSRGLAFGTMRNIGPGLFPYMLSMLMMALSALVISVALVQSRRQGRAVARLNLDKGDVRPVLAVIGSSILMALLVKPLGFPLAVMVMVFCTTLGLPRFDLPKRIFLAIGLAACTYGFFIFGLGRPVLLLGSLFGG